MPQLGTIRRATAADALDCARVHVAAWRAGYRGLLPDSFLGALTPEQRLPSWIEQLTPPTPVSTFVAGDPINGLVSCGPARDSEREGEVYAIYVDPDAWRRGIGRSLLRRAEDHLRDAGFGDAILWVLETNAVARRFYERMGWRVDGGVKIDRIFDGQLEVYETRYRTSLW